MGLIENVLYRRTKARALAPEDAAGMARTQALAYACAKDIAGLMKEGWTEAQTARLLDVCLRDNGVKIHFHKSFAWFGDRTRFDGVNGLRGFLPTSRPLKLGDAVILDTAPVYRGFPADIGYSFGFGANEKVEKGREFLVELRGVILELFDRAAGSGLSGGDICDAVVRRIKSAGYDPVHHRYPGAVLGHRLHAMNEAWRPPTFNPFSWQVFSRFLREGVVPDLLNEAHRGDLAGAWAVEPHLGGGGFGCKFEEILIVDESGARWLSPEIPW